jgi:hypothetical protein
MELQLILRIAAISCCGDCRLIGRFNACSKALRKGKLSFRSFMTLTKSPRSSLPFSDLSSDRNHHRYKRPPKITLETANTQPFGMMPPRRRVDLFTTINLPEQQQQPTSKSGCEVSESFGSTQDGGSNLIVGVGYARIHNLSDAVVSTLLDVEGERSKFKEEGGRRILFILVR